MKRKYRKITGWWIYIHYTPDGMYYVGCSKQKEVHKRFDVSNYKSSELFKHIQQYGWDNIKHFIIRDGLTEEQARKLEDQLIVAYTENECCLNKNRSGWISKDIQQYHSNYKNKKRNP